MAIYPWIVPYEKQGQNLDNFPHLKSWFGRMEQRPAVKKAYEAGNAFNSNTTMTEEAKRILFGQGTR